MSSVRISPHNRAAPAPTAASGESGRADAAPGGANFALVLSAAVPIKKEPETASFASGADGADDSVRISRKRSGGDHGAVDAAAMLAAQGSLSIPVPPPSDAVEAVASPRLTSDGDMRNAAIAGLSPAEDRGSSVAAGKRAAASAFAATDVPPGRTGAPIAVTAPDDATTSPQPAQSVVLINSMASPTPADAAVGAADVLSNAGPERSVLGSPNPAQAPRDGLAQLAPMLSLPAANGTAADREDPAAGDENRGRQTPIAFLSAGNNSVAAAFGAVGEKPAFAGASAAVSAASAPSPGQSAATIVTDQIAGHVIRLAASGSREMVMLLHPPELGELTVRLAVNGRDISAWFGSPQPQVQLAITDGIAQLQTGLGNAGYNLSGAWVGADASGSQHHGDRFPPRSLAPKDDPIVAAGAGASHPSPSAVNIYV